MINRSPDFEVRLGEYLDSCYKVETPPRVSELADSMGLTAAQLSKQFRRTFGANLSDYLKSKQCEYAEVLLRDTEMTVTKVAYKAGFGTRRTFFRTYRRVKGETPDQYRSRIRGPEEGHAHGNGSGNNGNGSGPPSLPVEEDVG